MATKQIPIKEHIFHSKSSGPLISPPHDKPTRYRHYDIDRLEHTCKVVLDHGMSLRWAAEEFQIPKSTIQDHVSGKVVLGSLCQQWYLSDQEEKELVKFLVESAKVGYPRTRKQILALVQRVLQEKGKSDANVSSGWWEGLKKRNPEVTLHAAEPLSLTRATSCTSEALGKYMDLLQQTLSDNDML